MNKISVISIKGENKASIEAPELWNVKPNLNLLAQAVRVYEDRSHPGLSKVQTRGEIEITTRKIYKQKGTGGARHGARSAPIFVGGGIAHGPKGIKRVLRLPKKMKKVALNYAMNMKIGTGEVYIIDGLELLQKTSDAAKIVSQVTKGTKDKKTLKTAFVISDKNKAKEKMLRNLGDSKVINFRELNAYEVYYGGILLVDKEVLSEFGKRKEIKVDINAQKLDLKKTKTNSVKLKKVVKPKREKVTIKAPKKK